MRLKQSDFSAKLYELEKEYRRYSLSISYPIILSFPWQHIPCMFAQPPEKRLSPGEKLPSVPDKKYMDLAAMGGVTGGRGIRGKAADEAGRFRACWEALCAVRQGTCLHGFGVETVVLLSGGSSGAGNVGHAAGSRKRSWAGPYGATTRVSPAGGAGHHLPGTIWPCCGAWSPGRARTGGAAGAC